ncbi:MAG: AMIN domain-containing protein [Acidobacteriota bacterium]
MQTMKTNALVLTLLIISGVALAQENQFGNIAERQRTSTVLGGTGMFNTFSTRTLYKGEFNFAAFWNRFNRDPGGLRIDQTPFNFTVGLTNRWELWVDWVAWQKTKSNNPLLLSGYQYNAVRLFGDPVQILGPPSGGDGNAAFFPGTEVEGGGILPALGRFGTPAGLNGVSTTSPGGAGGPLVAGLGPAIVTNQANFYNDLPFFGVVDFLGFDGLGRPVLGPRPSANGSGDVYVGSKYNLIDANRHWFSMALGGYVKIPISREDGARARGRTNGEYEYGPILIFGQENSSHRLRFYENVGYIHTGDIRKGGVKVLDLRDKVLLNAGASFALNKYIEFLAEVASTVYVGDGTRSLERINPVDLNVGMRFYLRGGSIAFGGGYRYALNSASKRTLSVLECMKIVKEHQVNSYSDPHIYGGPPPPPPPVIECKPKEFEFGEGERHGFVGFFSIGTRNGCPPPPVPSCVVEASPAVITRGDRLTLTAKATTPGYPDAKVSYKFRWEVKDAQGRSVGLNGSGATVEVPTAQLACGGYSVTTTVTVTTEAIDHPSGCVSTGESNCSTSFEVTEPPCPNVTCSIIASASTVTEGDRVALRAAIAGAGRSTCTWTTTGGRLSSTTGTEVTLDTTGVTSPVTIRAMVTTDQRRCDQPCPGSSCVARITVQPIPPPPRRPEVIKPCGPISFQFNSARINNEHKACLDQIQLALQQDPRAALVIDGHRDSSERPGISLTRANNVRDYLVSEKGVDPARITVRNFGDTCPQERSDAQVNRRVEMWILPEGSTLSDIDAVKRCREGSTPREITDEQPALGDPVRPSRTRRPEPIGALAEPESRLSPNITATTSTRSERQLAPASVVRSVGVKMVEGALRVTVATDRAVQFKDFTLTGPSRIVIDLTGVRSELGSKTIPVTGSLVDRVRVGEPGPGAVRIVIDLRTNLRYQVMRDGSSLVVIVGEEGAAAASGGSR